MKRLDFDKPTFEANGKTYRIESELNIMRYKAMEQLEIEFYYGFTMKEMFEKLKLAYGDINKNKLADSAVKIYQLMEGVADRVDKREPVILRTCSLFLNAEGEDINKWDEEIAAAKIADWQEEGYAMSDFFTLAANLVPGFIRHYQEILNDSLMTEEQESGEKSQSESKKQS